MLNSNTKSKIEISNIIKLIEEGDSLEFENCLILDDLELVSDEMKGKLIFKNCEFKGILKFDSVTFKQMLNFSGSTFHKEISFQSSLFYKDVLFDQAPFIKEVDFSDIHAVQYAKPNSNSSHQILDVKPVISFEEVA